LTTSIDYNSLSDPLTFQLTAVDCLTGDVFEFYIDSISKPGVYSVTPGKVFASFQDEEGQKLDSNNLYSSQYYRYQSVSGEIVITDFSENLIMNNTSHGETKRPVWITGRFDMVFLSRAPRGERTVIEISQGFFAATYS